MSRSSSLDVQSHFPTFANEQAAPWQTIFRVFFIRARPHPQAGRLRSQYALAEKPRDRKKEPFPLLLSFQTAFDNFPVNVGKEGVDVFRAICGFVI